MSTNQGSLRTAATTRSQRRLEQVLPVPLEGSRPVGTLALDFQPPGAAASTRTARAEEPSSPKHATASSGSQGGGDLFLLNSDHRVVETSSAGGHRSGRWTLPTFQREDAPVPTCRIGERQSTPTGTSGRTARPGGCRLSPTPSPLSGTPSGWLPGRAPWDTAR